MQQSATGLLLPSRTPLNPHYQKFSPKPPPETSTTSHTWVYLYTVNVILGLVAILQAHLIPHIKQKKLTNELSAALKALKKAIVTNAATLAKEIGGEEEGSDKE